MIRDVITLHQEEDQVFPNSASIVVPDFASKALLARLC
jgi:hypothetical protein